MNPIFRKLALASAVVVMGAFSPALAQQVVFDPTAAINFAKGLVEVKAQLDTAKSQLLEAQKMYESVTGNRGFGDLLREGDFEQYLPSNAKGLYDGSGGGAGISGSLADIQREEQERLKGAVPEMEADVRDRARRMAATQKALGLRGYEGAKARLAEIEALMDQISQTRDPKALGELQARLAGEQALIANEKTKLEFVASLQAAEDKLISEQRQEISRRILDPANEGMPSIDSTSIGQ